MGYTSKDIANITEPKIVTLSASPNFVQFASKTNAKTFLEANITVNIPTAQNLLNPATIVDGKYVDWDTGNFLDNVEYFYTALIAVKPNTTYKVLRSNGANAFGCDCFYDANQVFVDGGFYFDNGITTPANVYFIRLSLKGLGNTPPQTPNTYGLFEGTAAVWSPYSGLPSALPAKTLLRITEPSGGVHEFHGTNDPLEVGGSVYYVATDKADTAENLRQALIANRWINANLEIRIPSTWVGGAVTNGQTLNIKSKGAGAEYNIQIAAPNNTANVAYTIAWVNQTSTNGDTISGEASTAVIELDVYENADVFLGADDRPITTAKLGTYAATLAKTYAGVPLWFELNALFSQYAGFNLPPSTSGWFNTGTARTYRFIAKKRGVNSFAFYQSNALFVLNGYGPASEALDLTPYVYDNNSIKLLTNKPRTPYMRGQKEFLNFIFSDPLRGEAVDVFNLRVAYRVYSASDSYLGIVYAHTIARTGLNVVNTCVLNIDAVLDQYPKAGIVRVALSRDNAIISNDLEYLIRPECLHELQYFVFLNRLGGWDTFNFDSTIRDEIKPTTETYNKTLTPAHTKGQSLETVYSVALANTFTIEGAPVTDEVAEWLKELAAARVMLDKEGNYVIKDDFNLQTTDEAQNFQRPTIKYRLSETFTND